MAGVRNNVNDRVTVVDMLVPQSTATLGLESGTLDTRTYPAGSRFVATFAQGAQTEGTLTYTVVESATSGGTYTAIPAARLYGTLVTGTSTSAATSLNQSQGFVPDPAKPWVKLKSVETVSVTTAVPVHFYVTVYPSTVI